MSNYIECPNGGKCGHRKHHIRSESYRQCLSIANGHGNLAQPGAVTAAPPTTSSWNKAKVLDMLLNGDSDYYEPPEFFVTDDMKIEEKLIQSYIGTGNMDGLIKKEWEREIKSSIKENLTGDVADEMDELSGRSDSELDSLVDAVFDSEKYNIARAIASKQKPRTFVHYYEAPNGLKTRQRVLDKARSKCKVGSDEWFDLLAESYYNDVTSTSPNVTGGRLSKSEEDRQAIVSALKEAMAADLDDMGDGIWDIFPEITIVWTGNIRDVAPNNDDAEGEELIISSPYLVMRDVLDDRLSSPIRLAGDYRIKIPDRAERKHGATSGIDDDMTMNKISRYFDYPDGVGLDEYKPGKISRFYL